MSLLAHSSLFRRWFIQPLASRSIDCLLVVRISGALLGINFHQSLKLSRMIFLIWSDNSHELALLLGFCFLKLKLRLLVWSQKSVGLVACFFSSLLSLRSSCLLLLEFLEFHSFLDLLLLLQLFDCILLFFGFESFLISLLDLFEDLLKSLIEKCFQLFVILEIELDESTLCCIPSLPGVFLLLVLFK